MASVVSDVPWVVDGRKGSNPFVYLPRSARIVVIVYFVMWRVFPLLAEMVGLSNEGIAMQALSLLTQVAIECAILYPFLCGRFAGSPIGWAHPLVLPTLVSIALNILRNPEHLFAPLSVWGPGSEFSHPLIGSWPLGQIQASQLKLHSITLLSILSTYAGFSYFRTKRIPHVRLPSLSGYRFFGIFLIFFAVVLFFIERQGGVIAQMTSLAGGRFRMRELVGHFLVLSNFLPYLLVFWFLYRPRVLKNPLFIFAFILVCILQFVVTGSRSGLFVPFAAMLVAWMLVRHRFPALRAAMLGLLAFVFLGALGEVRQSGNQGQVSFEALLDGNVVENWERTQEALDAQDRGTNLAVAALVPGEVDHLWGRSYVAAGAFWLPRSLWRDKPRGIGPHVAALLYGGRSSMDGYKGAGYPVSAQSEAYWNFGWLGVPIVFFLYGGLVRFVADWRERASNDPVAAMVLVLMVFQFASPSTVSMVSFLQNLVLLAITVFVAKVRIAR